MGEPEFDQLCDGILAPVLAGLETTRQAAVKRYWLILAGAAALAVLAAVFVPGTAVKLLVVVAVLLVGWIVASGPLDKAAR